jgi:hypothetical protein
VDVKYVALQQTGIPLIRGGMYRNIIYVHEGKPSMYILTNHGIKKAKRYIDDVAHEIEEASKIPGVVINIDKECVTTVAKIERELNRFVRKKGNENLDMALTDGVWRSQNMLMLEYNKDFVALDGEHEIYGIDDFIAWVCNEKSNMADGEYLVTLKFISEIVDSIVDIVNQSGVFDEFVFNTKFAELLYTEMNRKGEVKINGDAFVSEDKKCRINIQYSDDRENKEFNITLVNVLPNGKIQFSGTIFPGEAMAS